MFVKECINVIIIIIIIICITFFLLLSLLSLLLIIINIIIISSNIIESIHYYVKKRLFVNQVSDIHDDTHIYQNNTSDLRKNNQNKDHEMLLLNTKTHTIAMNVQYKKHFKNMY